MSTIGTLGTPSDPSSSRLLFEGGELGLRNSVKATSRDVIMLDGNLICGV